MSDSAADIFYENYRNLSGSLRKKLSLSDLHELFAVMVQPCLTDLQNELSQYQAALLDDFGVGVRE